MNHIIQVQTLVTHKCDSKSKVINYDASTKLICEKLSLNVN